ncbi:hypothetical protein AM493_04810 [Flavobacterium akiainvivens]|uniref:HTH cro/C1-type domain-containing protein n=1 Tax=Flavobacterium akiainvivens TaxID=1202724 RepID=A0A0M8MBS4_9FLAO|nr:helix-turn-helix transcriptional regulator [Flavobacterium akiainvivens]KOS05424.1 hypothetical protein AM493_04810 [Flavobacterium akiainvivens]SFQ78210.1 Helix-turn-helix [Flavobacterium akiainvivens]
MTIEIIISELDFWIMEAIRESRINAGLDQVELAHKVGVSEGHIGNIENPRNRTKANVRIIGRIAKALDLKSYNELLPKKVLCNDMVKIRLKLLQTSSRKQIKDQDGNIPKRHEVLSISPLSENELELLKQNKLDYLTILE